MSWIRYPEYKNSSVEWLGKIPAHWTFLSLKFAVQPKWGAIKPGPFGSQLLLSEMQSGNIKVYNQKNIIENDFHWGENYISDEKYQELRPFAIEPGDILVTTRGTIGRCAIAPDSLEPGILHPCLMRIQPDARKVLPKFLVVLIQDSFLVQVQLMLASNATTIDVIYSDTLKRMRLPLPPLPEQAAIVDFIERETGKIDALVEKKERLIELLQEKRSALITQTVTKGLDPNVPMKDSGMEWLGQIPAHWDMTFLDKVVDPLRKITYGIVQPGAPDPEGILMVRGQNYSRGWSNPEEIFRVSPEIEAPYKRARLQGGDIVMTIVGAGTGNVAIVPDWLEGANLTQTTARIAVFQRKGNNRYIAYLLQSVVGKVSVELTVKGAAQPGLNLGHIAKYRVILPPDGEQERIADFLAREVAKLDRLIDKIHESIDGMNEYRIALISAAVTGKIDVREKVAS